MAPIPILRELYDLSKKQHAVENVIYVSAHEMLTQLRAARADATHES